jgi:hypothetical protein
MNNNNSLIPGSGVNKISPWSRPGGKLGMVVLGCIVAGGIMLFNDILPWLILFTKNTITLVIMIVVLCTILYVITQPKTWRMLSTIYFLIMRKITGLFIKIDPIAIMERHVDEMRERVKKMKKAMIELRGLVKRNKARLEDKELALQNELIKLKKYRETNQLAGVRQSEIMVKMLEESVSKRRQRLVNSEKWVKVLSKVSEYASIQADYNYQFVQLKKEEYEEVKAQHNAFKSAMSVRNNNPDALAEYNMALEYMDTDMAMKLGEMESVLDEAGGLLGQIDMEETITSERADMILAQFENGEGIFSPETWSAPLPEKGNVVNTLAVNSDNNDIFNF